MTGVGVEFEDKPQRSVHHSPAEDSSQADGQREGNEKDKKYFLTLMFGLDVTGEAGRDLRRLHQHQQSSETSGGSCRELKT